MHLLPSTSSHDLENSAQFKSPTIKRNTLRHLLQYLITTFNNRKEVTKIVNAKRKISEIKVTTFAKSKRVAQNVIKPSTSGLSANQSQTRQSTHNTPVRRTAKTGNGSVAQNSNRSNASSANVSQTSMSKKTSTTSKVSKSNYSSQNKRKTTNEKIKRSKKVTEPLQNASRQNGMESCSLTFNKKRTSLSQQSSGLDSKEKSRSGRQSSITGPLHSPQAIKQWVNTYKIPRLKKSNGT